MWFKFLIIGLVLGLAGVVWLGLKQRHLLKRKTKDALGKELKREIEQEKSEYYRSQERFEKAMSHQKEILNSNKKKYTAIHDPPTLL